MFGVERETTRSWCWIYSLFCISCSDQYRLTHHCSVPSAALDSHFSLLVIVSSSPSPSLFPSLSTGRPSLSRFIRLSNSSSSSCILGWWNEGETAYSSRDQSLFLPCPSGIHLSLRLPNGIIKEHVFSELSKLRADHKRYLNPTPYKARYD